MKKRGFIPITTKINLLIIATLVFGIGAISFFFFETITQEIDNSISRNFDQQGAILFAAIQNFMIPGEAELAVNFFTGLRDESDGANSVQLIRRDGKLAFSDFSTIDDVVQRVPNLRTKFADPGTRIIGDMAIMSEEFSTAKSFPPVKVEFEKSEGDVIFFRAYVPLLNLPECTFCHGSDHTVRGVIDIRHDVTSQRNRQFEAGITSGGLYVSIVVLLTIILALFMRRTIVRPVKTIGAVCTNVTDGDFEHRVAVKTRDEIGRLGDTVNTMVDGLYERFQLQKYVSSKTLESLLGDNTGSTTSLTMLFSDIRGFTSYTEKRSAEEVVRHLNAVLNVQSEIIQRHGGDIDKYVGDEIVAMFSEESQAIDAISAALEIQQNLTENSPSEYDGLRVGIGINTGDVILGMIGSERRADYTFIGDNVNTASRLCDAAEPGGILVSDSTFGMANESLEVEGPFRLKAKGKEEYVKVYRVTGINATEEPEGTT
jgi:adenylate cyclase